MSPFRRLLVPLGLVGLAAAVIRWLYLWSYADHLPFLSQPVLDAAYYDAWARAIVQGKSFVAGPYYHAPGYPWFLAAIYKVLGPDPVHAVVVQAVLGVMTTLITMLLAGRLFGRREAILGGILMLGSGTLYFYESKLLVETWSLFLGTVAVYLAVLADGGLRPPMDRAEAQAAARAAQEGRKPAPAGRWALAAAVAAGLAAGAMSVTRPNLILVPLVLGLVFVIRAAGRFRPWSTTLLFLAGFALALLPTSLHNISQGALAPVATNGGLNFYAGNYSGARGVYEDPPGFSGVIARQEAEADSVIASALGHHLPAGQESSYWMARGFSEIAADPPRWLGLEARKLWLLVNRQEEEVNGNFGLEASRIPYLRLLGLPFNFLVAAGLAGLCLAAGLFGLKRGAQASLAAPVAMLITVLATGLGFFVMARLRLAAFPVLAGLAGHALARADLAWRDGHRKPVILALAAGAVFMGLSWRSPLGPSRNPVWESRLFLEAGRGLETGGNHDRAVKAYQDALQLNPANVHALLHLGQMALTRHDLAEAIGYFERARQVAPKDLTVRNNLGILYYQAQRYEDAISEMTAALRIRPDQPGPYLYQGLAARQLGNTELAEAEFKKALELDPRYVGAYVRLIELLLDRGAVDEAHAWANQAAERAVALPPGLAARLR